MPEIGFTLGYDLTSRLKATVGYTLLYWSNVARPGDQIDLNVDSRQFPPPHDGDVREAGIRSAHVGLLGPGSQLGPGLSLLTCRVRGANRPENGGLPTESNP